MIIDAVAQSHDWSKENDDVHNISIIQKRFLNDWFKLNLKKMKQILIADTFKKFEGKEWVRTSNFASYDRDKLKAKIEEHYKVELVKDESDDFPFFTDGGFKYQCKTENFEFMTTAYFYDVV